MDSRQIKDASIVLPSVDEDILEQVSVLDGDSREFRYADVEARQIELAGIRLVGGMLHNVRAEALTLDNVVLESVIFDHCNFSAINVNESSMARVIFKDCQLNGLRFTNTKLSDVIFEGSRLDYGLWQDVRAARPVAFVSCSLKDTSLVNCSFRASVFDKCRLDELELERGHYEDCDFRGSDLSGVNGVTVLRQARISQSQLPQLAEAVARELRFVVED